MKRWLLILSLVMISMIGLNSCEVEGTTYPDTYYYGYYGHPHYWWHGYYYHPHYYYRPHYDGGWHGGRLNGGYRGGGMRGTWHGGGFHGGHR